MIVKGSFDVTELNTCYAALRNIVLYTINNKYERSFRPEKRRWQKPWTLSCICGFFPSKWTHAALPCRSWARAPLPIASRDAVPGFYWPEVLECGAAALLILLCCLKVMSFLCIKTNEKNPTHSPNGSLRKYKIPARQFPWSLLGPCRCCQRSLAYWTARPCYMVEGGTGVPSEILHSIHESLLKCLQSKQVQHSKSCGSFAWINTALKAVPSLKLCNLLLFLSK